MRGRLVAAGLALTLTLAPSALARKKAPELAAGQTTVGGPLSGELAAGSAVQVWSQTGVAPNVCLTLVNRSRRGVVRGDLDTLSFKAAPGQVRVACADASAIVLACEVEGCRLSWRVDAT